MHMTWLSAGHVSRQVSADARAVARKDGYSVTARCRSCDPAKAGMADRGDVLVILPMPHIRRSHSWAANRRRVNLTDKGRLPTALEREFLCIHHELVDLCILELEVDNYFASDCAVNVEHHRRSDVIYHNI